MNPPWSCSKGANGATDKTSCAPPSWVSWFAAVDPGQTAGLARARVRVFCAAQILAVMRVLNPFAFTCCSSKCRSPQVVAPYLSGGSEFAAVGEAFRRQPVSASVFFLANHQKVCRPNLHHQSTDSGPSSTSRSLPAPSTFSLGFGSGTPRPALSPGLRLDLLLDLLPWPSVLVAGNMYKGWAFRSLLSPSPTFPQAFPRLPQTAHSFSPTLSHNPPSSLPSPLPSLNSQPWLAVQQLLSLFRATPLSRPSFRRVTVSCASSFAPSLALSSSH